MITNTHVSKAIDSITESVRINGCESEITDAIIDFLAENIDAIVNKMALREESTHEEEG